MLNFFFNFQENKNRRQYYYNNFEDESYDIKISKESTTSSPSQRNNPPITSSDYDRLKSITSVTNDNYGNDKTDYNVNEVESDFPTYFPTRVIHSTSNHLDNKVVTTGNHEKNEISNKNVFATLKVVDNDPDLDKKKKNPTIKGKLYDFLKI